MRPRSDHAQIDAAPFPTDHPCGRCTIRLQTFCGSLSPDALARLKALGTNGRALRGQCLFHEGDPADRVHNLTAGSLKLYRLLPDGRRQVAGFARAGDFLGLTGESEHLYTAEAMEPTDYCRFPRERFEAFLERHAEIGRALYLLARRQLAAARDQTLLLARKNAPERIASFLLTRRDEQGGGAAVSLPMTRSDIADHLGLTKETVSRTLTVFRKARLIGDAGGGGVVLLQPARLERLAAGAS